MTTTIQRKSDTIFLSLMTAMLCATGVVSTALAEDVYQLNATTTTGVDLTGYATDRMEGPSSANIEFSGSIVGASGTAESPFELIGKGRSITVTADNSSFHTLPLKLYNADGVTATSTLKFNAGSIFGSGSLDVGAHNRYNFGYTNNGKVTLAYNSIYVHDGGILDGYALYLGYNAPVCVSVTDGGSIATAENSTIADMYLGYQTESETSEPVTAFLGITNATVSVRHDKILSVMVGVSTGDRNNANCRIVLGQDGILTAAQLNHHGAGSTDVVFDGGRFASASDLASTPVFNVAGSRNVAGKYPNPDMRLISANGNPIDLETAYDRPLAGGKSSGSVKVSLQGDGGFTKRGNGILYFNRHNESTCDYTGPTTILGGGIVVSNAVFKVGRGELTVAENAFLDLNGFDVEFSGSAGAGIVTNGSATASTLTLGYGNATSTLTTSVSERISLVKTGTGTLTVSGDAANNTCALDITAGTVVFNVRTSSSYGTVTVRAGATLDISRCNFSCANLVKESGGKIINPPGLVIVFK